MTYTGYLRRSAVGSGGPLALDGREVTDPYVLVTTGGGGDGTVLVDWVLRAYEQDRGLPHNAIIVYGPFMDREAQLAFQSRVDRLPRVQAVDFVPNMEDFVAKSVGVVAMGGYNTVCEILSFDRPGLIVPRSVPRLEQTIRARRLQELGLLRMLSDSDGVHARRMADAIRALPSQPKPSDGGLPGLMDGFSMINATVDRWAEEIQPAPLSVIRA